MASWARFGLRAVVWRPLHYTNTTMKVEGAFPSRVTSNQCTKHRYEFLSRNTMTWQAETCGHQHCTSATLPKAFHDEPSHMLSPGRQNMCKHLGILQDFSKNCWRVKILSVLLRLGWNRIGYQSTLAQLFRSTIFLRGTWHTFFQGS